MALQEWVYSMGFSNQESVYTYATTVVLSEGVPDMRFIIDIPYSEVQETLNGKRGMEIVLNDTVAEISPVWEFDINWKVFCLGHLLRSGDNVLRVRIYKGVDYPFDRDRSAEYLGDGCWLRGDFAGLEYGHTLKLGSVENIHLGAWEDQGYKYFSGTGIYRQKIAVDSSLIGYGLLLDLGRVGEIADVFVNGEHAGLLPWQPYVVEVTDLVKEGENEFAIHVTNTMRNMLEGPEKGPYFSEPIREPFHYKPSGLLGPVKLVPYIKRGVELFV